MDFRTHFAPFNVNFDEKRKGFALLYPLPPDSETDAYILARYGKNKNGYYRADRDLRRWGNSMVSCIRRTVTKPMEGKNIYLHIFMVNATRRYLPVELNTLFESCSGFMIRDFVYLSKIIIDYVRLDTPPFLIALFVPMSDYEAQGLTPFEPFKLDTVNAIIGSPAIKNTMIVFKELSRRNNDVSG